MKVIINTILAGPDGSAQPGQVIDVSAKEGKALIAGGYAEKYLDPAEAEAKAKAKVPKTADAPPAPETAEKPKPKAHKSRKGK